MEGKKISFGFLKTKKVEKPVIEEKKEFIDCLEEQSIKIIGGEVIEEKAPLVIPLKPNTIVTAERLKQIAKEVETSIENIQPSTDEIKQEVVVIKEEVAEDAETLDQMAVRELMEDAKKVVKVETKTLTVPVPALPVLDGQKESTLDDYEAVPVKDYGLAMLRGMGWTPGNQQSKVKEPQQRPKGLGLGADKVMKQSQKSTRPEDKELMIVKNAFVKVTAGKYSGYYGKYWTEKKCYLKKMCARNLSSMRCTGGAPGDSLPKLSELEQQMVAVMGGEQFATANRKLPLNPLPTQEVLSLDEDNGRVMVELPVSKETASLSEFMMQPVTKAEYDKESRVINAEKFHEYKNKEQPQKTSRESRDDLKKYNERQGTSKSSEVSKEQRRTEESPSRRRDENSSNGRSRAKETRRRDSSSSEERYKREKKDKKRYSSNESLRSSEDGRSRKKERNKDDSESGSSDTNRKHKKSKKHRKRDGTPEVKRDIDKKRKGKKKRRDRDRSPNYKKHRK